MVIPVMYWRWILCLALLVIGCGSAEERKASYVAKANAFIQEGNFPKARVALRNALKIDPKDPHVYFLAGQVERKRPISAMPYVSTGGWLNWMQRIGKPWDDWRGFI